jgi:glycosyltransferase involved in cell wall biosynthesis
LKVALINAKYGGVSGSGRHVYNLHKHLKDRAEFEIFDINKVGYVNIPKLKSITFYRNLKRLKISADIIHIHNPKFAGISVDPKKSILTIHGNYVTELMKKYGIVGESVSNHIKKNIEKFPIITTVNPYWAKLQGWRYIPNGISLNEISSIRKSENKYVLFVGRKDKIKGYEIFKKMAKSLSIPTKMLFDEPWENVISHLKSAHCLVMPSQSEGFPTVILEAWASGCPVITSDIKELRALSNQSIQFSNRDPKSFIESVNKVVEDGIGKKLAENGLEEIKDYDWNIIAEKYYSLYKEVLEK